MKTHREKGFNQLKNDLSLNKKCLGVICGGDGTVTWVISELHKYQINSSEVPFAVIPLGTGNDFSQSLGWGATTEDLISDDYRKLKKFLIKMLLSKSEDLDVWEVTARAHEYGKI